MKGVYKMAKCGVCDAVYDKTKPVESNIHRHAEPQSGIPRAAFIASGLPYDRWIRETPDGKAWRRRQTR
jgi:hypothetical protein